MSRRKSLTTEDEETLRALLMERDRLLNALGVYSVKELAFRFNVSRRTIVRSSYRLLSRHRRQLPIEGQ